MRESIIHSNESWNSLSLRNNHYIHLYVPLSNATSGLHILKKNGAYSYLGDVEIYKFKIRVFEASCNLNCIKTIESVQICHEFRTDRYLRA